MNILQKLIGREFDTVHYERGHQTRHRIGNIIVYIITGIGFFVLLSVAFWLTYSIIHMGWLALIAIIPTWIIAIGLAVLLIYGVSKSQFPED